MTELKPCPFCGNVTHILVTNTIELDDDDEDTPVLMHVVVCNYNIEGCGASSGYYVDPDEAVVAWNRRVWP
jgi:hypothetical protein